MIKMAYKILNTDDYEIKVRDTKKESVYIKLQNCKRLCEVDLINGVIYIQDGDENCIAYLEIPSSYDDDD